MHRFIDWVNADNGIDPVLKAGIAHLWFLDCFDRALSSTDTALNDIKDLVEKGVLRKNDEGGRSTNYSLVAE